MRLQRKIEQLVSQQASEWIEVLKTGGQKDREAFVAWANANPDQMSSKPIDGLWRAMAETYPCPK